jgi:TRAP-type uncharacterized transport system fused permease subunit
MTRYEFRGPAACLVTLFFLAGIGTPIGYSIILAALVYLGLGGIDLALAGEKIMQGLYRSFVLLAVPLFIVAANIMNAGTISDRLLGFCVAAVGRFRGGLGHVNVVASLIFSGMSGSAVADAAGIGKIIIEMMTRAGAIAGATPPRSPPPRPPSARSSRPRSRWCSMRWSPTARSARCFWPGSCRAS